MLMPFTLPPTTGYVQISESTQVEVPNHIPAILLMFPIPVKATGYECTKNNRLGKQVALCTQLKAQKI